MELRPLRADEGLAYRAVRLRALELAPEAFGETLAEAIAQPEQTWHDLARRTAEDMASALFVLDRGDGALAGTVYVRVDEQTPYLAHLGAMWVDEDLRGTVAGSAGYPRGGWSDALIEHAEGWARRLGAPGVLLWVSAGNERAWRFYTRHGYAPTGAADPHGNAAGETIELYHPFD